MAPSTPFLSVEESMDDGGEYVNHSVSRDQGNDGGLMKEEDAEILERGVGDSCSSGRTPVLAPISPPASNDLPMLTGSSSKNIEKAQGCPVNYGVHVEESERLPNQMSVSFENGFELSDTGHDAAGERQSSYVGDVYRRCLSGDVRRYSGIEPQHVVQDSTPSLEMTSDVDSSAASLRSDSDQFAFQIERGMSTRSKSFDRRLNEAVQFAEAVGELPPKHQDEVQVIIEESGSEYDDDSDDEVHMQDAPPSPSHNATAGSRTDETRSVIECESSVEPEPEDHAFDLGVTKKPKSRPQWPFKTTMAHGPSTDFLHKLPAGVEPPDFVYKGISSNPPEVTQRGLSRGNYAQLHRKAWLEVSDKYHRYGKNLRLYYRYWERLGFPTNQFFDWLDSKGEAAGQSLPNLEDCPRSQLDADTVLYIANPEITDGYELDIQADDSGRGLVVDVDGDPVLTGLDGWIFVLRDKKLYGAQKITSVNGHSKQRFHHSSFFGGKAVAAAGILLTDERGYLTRFYPHSGHYRPGEADVQRMLFFLHHKGVQMRTFDVDTQQILHVSRHEATRKAGQVSDEAAEKKKKKTQSLHLKPAVYVSCLLAHKARLIGEGTFDQLHSIRKADVATVSEALDAVDDGGIWKRMCREFRGA